MYVTEKTTCCCRCENGGIMFLGQIGYSASSFHDMLSSTDHLTYVKVLHVFIAIYEGQSKSFAIQYDAQLTRAEQLYYCST